MAQVSSDFVDTASVSPMAVTAPAGSTGVERIAACAAPIRASFLNGEAIALFRLGVSLAGQFQELSATLNRQFVASLAPISMRMNQLSREGIIEIEDGLSAAARLGGLAVEGTRYLMGHPTPPPDAFDLYNTAIADLYLNGLTGRAAALPSLEPNEPVAAATAALHLAVRPYFPAAADFRLSEEDLGRLLAVSRRKFFKAGYSETSLDDIGASARIGRGTLYRWFGAKEGLFKVTMLQAAAEIGAARLPAVKPGLPIERALADVALALSAALMGSTGTALYRTAIAEAAQFPELARTVHDLTRMRAMALLTGLLAEHPAGHGLTPGQRDWLAMQFITVSTDGNRYLSIDTKLTSADRRALAQRTVRAFLYGHRKLG